MIFLALGYIQGMLTGESEIDFDDLYSWGCYTQQNGLFLVFPLAAFADIMLDDIARSSTIVSEGDVRKILFIILIFTLFTGLYIWAADKYLGTAFVLFLLFIIAMKALNYYDIERKKENKKKIKSV